MQRKLVGLDLDGVVAKMNLGEYHKAKAQGISILRKYYCELQPNDELLYELYKQRQLFRYKIFTARQDEVPDMQELTLNWCKFHKVFDYLSDNIGLTTVPITHTLHRWKAPELIWHGASAMVDDNVYHLGLLPPWIKTIAYNPYYRGHTNIQTQQSRVDYITNDPKDLLDNLVRLCYPIR